VRIEVDNVVAVRIEVDNVVAVCIKVFVCVCFFVFRNRSVSGGPVAHCVC
jgi:hypothetical protein